MACTLLFASPDERERRAAVQAFGEKQVVLASSAAELLLGLPTEPEVVVLSIDLPGLSPAQLLSRILARENPPAVLLAIESMDRSEALELAKAGAAGWVMRPLNAELLAWKVQRLVDQRLGAPSFTPALAQAVGGIVGSSAAMERLRRMVARVAGTDLSVLITGESGTGKEVVARALHQASLRSAKPFVPVDCAAIPPNLMESELFGYEKGAFTGASSRRAGLVESAREGTFFLDEVGELEAGSQVKLLRLLQEGAYRPVGATVEKQVNLRVLAATNRQLEERIAEGGFRADLFHRLNVVRLHLPPLRDRPEDVAVLLRHFLDRFSAESGRPPLILGASIAATLAAYAWPGNVRELVNCARYVANLAPGPELTLNDLPPRLRAALGQIQEVQPSASSQAMGVGVRYELPYKEAKRAWLSIFEFAYVQHQLQAHDGNVSRAARACGMDRKSIQRLLKRAQEQDEPG
jgi:DNA-binding NtrC family response regulator